MSCGRYITHFYSPDGGPCLDCGHDPTADAVERVRDYLYRHQRAADTERADNRDDLTFGDIRAVFALAQKGSA